MSIVKDIYACIDDARKLVLSETVKHVDRVYQVTIYNISKRHVKLHYVPSEKMVVNFFTKNSVANEFA